MENQTQNLFILEEEESDEFSSCIREDLIMKNKAFDIEDFRNQFIKE